MFLGHHHPPEAVKTGVCVWTFIGPYPTLLGLQTHNGRCNIYTARVCRRGAVAEYVEDYTDFYPDRSEGMEEHGDGFVQGIGCNFGPFFDAAD